MKTTMTRTSHHDASNLVLDTIEMMLMLMLVMASSIVSPLLALNLAQDLVLTLTLALVLVRSPRMVVVGLDIIPVQ